MRTTSNVPCLKRDHSVPGGGATGCPGKPSPSPRSCIRGVDAGTTGSGDKVEMGAAAPPAPSRPPGTAPAALPPLVLGFGPPLGLEDVPGTLLGPLVGWGAWLHPKATSGNGRRAVQRHGKALTHVLVMPCVPVWPRQGTTGNNAHTRRAKGVPKPKAKAATTRPRADQRPRAGCERVRGDVPRTAIGGPHSGSTITGPAVTSLRALPPWK